MNMIEAVSSAALNLLSVYIDFRIVHIFLEKKNMNRFLSGMVFLLVWSLNWGIYFRYQNIYYTSVSMLILLFLGTVILYKGSLLRKLVAVCSSIGLGMAVDDIVWFMFKLGLLKDSEVTATFLVSLIMIVIVLGLEYFFRVDKAQYISKESYVNIIIVLAGNMILLNILAEITDEGSVETLFAVSVICVIDISTFYLYDKVNEIYYQRLRHRLAEERIAMYENQFEIMQQSQKNMSALRHDMKNHLYMLKAYLADEDYTKANLYIEEMENSMKVPGQHVNTGNKEVDMILNHAMEKAAALSCEVETKVTVPENTFMPEFDLVILLGNLLDNALEALEKAEERILKLEMRYQKGILFIEMGNTYDGNVVKKGHEYMTRKSDKNRHGMGLKNVKEIVKKYNGKEKICTEGTLFVIEIILYLKK